MISAVSNISFKSLNCRPKKGAQPSFTSSNILERTPSKDSFNAKKAIGIGVLTGVAALGAVRAVKAVQSNALKKEITLIYDEICTEATRSLAKHGINFEKPALCFQKAPAGRAIASYRTGTNEIILNTNKLSRGTFSVAKQKECTLLSTIKSQQTDKELNMAEVLLYENHPHTRRATKDEYLLKVKQILVHETTHAKQNQIALSTDNAVDKIIGAVKSRPENQSLTEADIMDVIKREKPFFLSYKRTGSSEGKVFRAVAPTGDKLEYTADDILKSLFGGYISQDVDRIAYYCNPVEIEAKIAEADIAQKALNDPKSKVSKEILAANSWANNFNVQSLLELFNGSV